MFLKRTRGKAVWSSATASSRLGWCPSPYRRSLHTFGTTRGEGDRQVEGKSRILSGIQPTGKVHLGNYVGAVLNCSGR